MRDLRVTRTHHDSQFYGPNRVLMCDCWDVVIARSSGAATCWIEDVGIERADGFYSGKQRMTLGVYPPIAVRNVKPLPPEDWGRGPFMDCGAPA